MRNNPTPAAGVPKCPPWFDKVAKAKWKELVPRLLEMGTLTAADAEVLTTLCLAWSSLVDAQKTIAKEGQTYMRDGLAKRNPAVTIAQQAMRDIRLSAEHFGMTPLSRQRLDVEAPQPPEPEDELESILNGTYSPGPGGVRSRDRRPGGVQARDRRPTAAEVRELDRFLNEPQDPPPAEAPPA